MLSNEFVARVVSVIEAFVSEQNFQDGTSRVCFVRTSKPIIL